MFNRNALIYKHFSNTIKYLIKEKVPTMPKLFNLYSVNSVKFVTHKHFKSLFFQK